jgi:hypothetical protein
MAPNLTGPGGRLFADPTPGPDEMSFQQNNVSAKYYSSAYYLAHIRFSRYRGGATISR